MFEMLSYGAEVMLEKASEAKRRGYLMKICQVVVQLAVALLQ